MIVNPPLWEVGHVAWFQEHWVLAHALGEAKTLADTLYDSSAIAHATRWNLPLPTRAQTIALLEQTRGGPRGLRTQAVQGLHERPEHGRAGAVPGHAPGSGEPMRPSEPESAVEQRGRHSGDPGAALPTPGKRRGARADLDVDAKHYTPGKLLYRIGQAKQKLQTAEMLARHVEEGLENVFTRHDRHAEATRHAAKAWGLDVLCKEPRHYSSSLTALVMPAGHDADNFRKVALEHFDVSLGTGLSKVAGKVFRIGHLGDTNDLTIIGALAGVEMGLALAGVPHRKGGVQAAMDYFAEARSSARAAAE